jgi:hypothetical protein
LMADGFIADIFVRLLVLRPCEPCGPCRYT